MISFNESNLDNNKIIKKLTYLFSSANVFAAHVSKCAISFVRKISYMEKKYRELPTNSPCLSSRLMGATHGYVFYSFTYFWVGKWRSISKTLTRQPLALKCFSFSRQTVARVRVWAGFKLTHWGRDKMDAITQTTFSSAFFWTKMFDFWLKFHWSLILRVQSTIFKHWFW